MVQQVKEGLLGSAALEFVSVSTCTVGIIYVGFSFPHICLVNLVQFGQ